jgi:hypothetical protein
MSDTAATAPEADPTPPPLVPTHRTTVQDVLAYQYHGDFSDLHRWVVENFGNPGSENPIIARDSTGRVSVVGPNYSQLLPVDGWVVCRLSNKTFSAVDQASFAADFEPAAAATTDKAKS